MEIIFNNGKKYSSPRPTFAVMLRTSELLAKLDNGTFLNENNIIDDLMELRDYVIFLFGNQFTEQEFDEYYAPEDITEFIEFGKECLYGVVVNPKRLKAMAKQLTAAEKLGKQVDMILDK